MTDNRISSGGRLFGCTIAALLATTSAVAAQAVIVNGQTVTNTQELSGNETLTIQNGGTLDVDDDAVQLDGAATNVRIRNFGDLLSDDRGIDTSGNGTTAPRNYRITNFATGMISSDNDGIRINTDVSEGDIVVTNSGLIESTSGQAIDFASIETGGEGVSTLITNTPEGIIRASDADAVRPGEEATVLNFGTISAMAAEDDGGNDGVDLRSAENSVVVNFDGGLIQGAHQGINGGNDEEGSLNALNFAGGTIIGQNGSGIGSDSGGFVFNGGEIVGMFTPAFGPNGDGDGVDIDDEAFIINRGLIFGSGSGGVDSGGNPNNAEALPIGGGFILNGREGIARGADRGILVDDGAGGPGVAETSVFNLGTIEGLNGFGSKFVGDFDDSFLNFGTLSGSNGIAAQLGDGDDLFLKTQNSVENGFVDGEAGENTFVFLPQLNIESPEIDIAEEDLIDLVQGGVEPGDILPDLPGLGEGFNPSDIAGSLADVAEEQEPLIGSGTLDIGSFAPDGQFRNFQGLFALGGFEEGSETTLTGNSGDIEEALFIGQVRLDGSLPNAEVVSFAGLLSGNATVGDLFLGPGTAIAPGDCIGTFNVLGDMEFSAGVPYFVEVGADGITADRINVGGNLAFDGVNILVIEGVDGGPLPLKSNNVIATFGTIEGDESQSIVDDDFLINLVIDEALGTMTLQTLDQSFPGFGSFANTRNQAAVAAVLDAALPDFDTPLPAFDAMMNGLAAGPAAAVAPSLEQLSGADYATAFWWLDRVQARMGQPAAGRAEAFAAGGGGGLPLPNVEALLNGQLASLMPLWLAEEPGAAASGEPNAAMTEAYGITPWISVIGGLSSLDGDGNGPGGSGHQVGVALGADKSYDLGFLEGSEALGGVWLAYANAQYGGDFGLDQESDLYQGGLYGAFRYKGWRVRAQGAYTRVESSGSRPVLGLTASGSTGGNGILFSHDGGYAFEVGRGGEIEPYHGLTYSFLDVGSFSETGGGAGNLAVEGNSVNSLEGRLGLRARLDQERTDGQGFTLRGAVAWTHEFLDDTGEITASFLGAPSSGSFTTSSPTFSRNGALVEVGAIYRSNFGLAFGLDYVGRFNMDRVDQGMALRASMPF